MLGLEHFGSLLNNYMTSKKQTDRGFEENQEGYKEIIRDEEIADLRQQYKVPYKCPACIQLIDNWDTKYWYLYGVCSNCFINYLDGRNLSDEIMRSQLKAQAYVIEQIKIKEKPPK